MKNYNDMALALAGVCQSVLLISQLAQKGEVDNQDAFQTTIHSLLITQPEDTLAVFGGDVQHLKVGLNTLIEQLTQLNDKQPEIKQELGRRIARLPEQLAYHDNQFDDEMFSIMANIYVDTISPLGKRIHIIGSAYHLQQQSVQDKIRACLLAGIRSAVLWRQVGGSKWQLLFHRKKLVQALKSKKFLLCLKKQTITLIKLWKNSVFKMLNVLKKLNVPRIMTLKRLSIS